MAKVICCRKPYPDREPIEIIRFMDTNKISKIFCEYCHEKPKFDDSSNQKNI
jgi:hypothetical protein